MKKRIKWIIIGFSFLILLIPLICLLVFISKTMNAGEADQYCLENTETNADLFYGTRYELYEEENPTQYAFWVAEDGLSGRQELFLFQNVQFGPFKKSRGWDRLRFAYHALGDEGEPVGSVMFTPRDLRSRKRTTNWMVFYSSNKEHIYKCIFSVEENGEPCTIEKAASINMAFAIVLPDLGEKNGVSRKFIKAEFYDVDGNLVATMGANTRKSETSEK